MVVVVGAKSLGSGVGPATRLHWPALRSHTSFAMVHLQASFFPQPSPTGLPQRLILFKMHLSGVQMHLLLSQL